MIVRKFIFLVCIVMTLSFTNRDTAIGRTSVVIEPESSLLVRGTTNVSTFNCLFNIDKLKSPIPVIYHMKEGKIQFNKTALILDNDCFDCGGQAINNDFQKILKSNKHPQILMFLKEVSHYQNNESTLALIDIQLAGITKTYQIPVKTKKTDKLLITGDLDINLSDYNIEPPKKFLGLVTVDDKIEINFRLVAKEY